MSTRAYRVNSMEIDLNDDASFNISRNYALMHALGLEADGSYEEVEVDKVQEVLDEAIDGELELSIGECISLAEDINFAKARKEDYVTYTCY